MGRVLRCLLLGIGVFGHAEGVLLLFNKEDISKMRQMLTEDWI